MDFREGVGPRQIFLRIPHEMIVGRIIPRSVPLMIQQDDEIRDVVRHELEEPPLLAPFRLRLHPLIQASVAIGHFLSKLLRL